MKSSAGVRRFYANDKADKLENISADAYLVNELIKDGSEYVSKYRYECKVYGDNLKEVYAMFGSDSEDRYDLVSMKDYQDKTVYQVKKEDSERFFETFPGEKEVRFNLKLNGSGEEFSNVKLDEKIYNSGIKALSEVRDYKREGRTITVNWKAIDEKSIYYFVEILKNDELGEIPYFRSERQPAMEKQDMSILISGSTASEINRLDQLVEEENYYIRIIGVKYEDEIHPVNSSNKEINIQAKTMFTYKITW